MKFTEKKAEILLVFVIAARATSFVFNKQLLDHMGVFNILALRFVIAAVVMGLIFHKGLFKMTKREALAGLAVGGCYFLVLWSELAATAVSPTSTVALLQNTAVVIVPIIEMILTRKAPKAVTVFGVILAMAGVACIALPQGEIGGGIAICFLSALLYAIAIVVTDRVTDESLKAMNVGIVQVAVIAVLSGVSTFLFETPTLPDGGGDWFRLLYLSLVCTGFGFTLVPVAQSRLSASRAGIICALSPAVAAVLGVIVLNENLGIWGIIGVVLILISIILPHIMEMRKESTSAHQECKDDK